MLLLNVQRYTLKIWNANPEHLMSDIYWRRFLGENCQFYSSAVSKKTPQKHSYQSVRPVTVNVSRNVIISVSADSITILLQQGPVSCLCFLNQRRRSSDWACSALTLVSIRLLSLGFRFFIKRSIIHITKTNKYVSVYMHVSVYKCIFMVLVVNGIIKYLTSV